MALLTIYCTAMIYTLTQEPIHQWYNHYVAPNYLALGLYSGAVLLAAVLHLLGLGSQLVDLVAMISGLAALIGKLTYWRFIATTSHPSSPESATGLGHLGKVRQFEAPHTEENYLMREMGFSIARKHAEKLRALSMLTLFAAPLVLMLIARSWQAASPRRSRRCQCAGAAHRYPASSSNALAILRRSSPRGDPVLRGTGRLKLPI